MEERDDAEKKIRNECEFITIEQKKSTKEYHIPTVLLSDDTRTKLKVLEILALERETDKVSLQESVEFLEMINEGISLKNGRLKAEIRYLRKVLGEEKLKVKSLKDRLKHFNTFISCVKNLSILGLFTYLVYLMSPF